MQFASVGYSKRWLSEWRQGALRTRSIASCRRCQYRPSCTASRSTPPSKQPVLTRISINSPVGCRRLCQTDPRRYWTHSSAVRTYECTETGWRACRLLRVARKMSSQLRKSEYGLPYVPLQYEPLPARRVSLPPAAAEYEPTPCAALRCAALRCAARSRGRRRSAVPLTP